MAEQEVVHFDLKCDNILLEALPGVSQQEFWAPSSDSPPFKLILADFGDSCDFSLAEQKLTTRWVNFLLQRLQVCCRYEMIGASEKADLLPCMFLEVKRTLLTSGLCCCHTSAAQLLPLFWEQSIHCIKHQLSAFCSRNDVPDGAASCDCAFAAYPIMTYCMIAHTCLVLARYQLACIHFCLLDFLVAVAEANSICAGALAQRATSLPKCWSQKSLAQRYSLASCP